MSKILKVYKPKRRTFDWELHGLDLYVFFAGGNFKFTDNFDNADIIPHKSIGCSDNLDTAYKFIRRRGLRNKIFLNLHLFLHVEESQTHRTLDEMLESENRFFNRLSRPSMPKHFILHCNLNLRDSKNYPKFIYSDFMWNRQIACFVDQPDHILSAHEYEPKSHWYPIHMRKAVYDLYDIDEYCNTKYIDEIKSNNQGDPFPLKSFYSNNNVRNMHYVNSEYVGFNEQKKSVPYSGNLQYKHADIRNNLRNELNKLLELYPGYVGKKASGSFLIGQDMTTNEYAKAIEGLNPNIGWWPVNNVYCRSTSVNIYVETLTYNHNHIRQFTEKTWDPLIKGNFILPFGQYGLIKDLKEIYGFMFPSWIDYGYDGLENDMLRWFGYLDSVKELLSNSPNDLFLKKIADKEILKHNREIFFKQGYRNPIPDSFD